MPIKKVTLYEVGPRDGLQNEPAAVPAAVKLALIDRLGAAGLTAIEATSFVSPKWIPQLGDHAEVMKDLTRRPGVIYPVLVPNEKGMAGAVAAGVREIAVFTAASDAFNQKNINCTIAESLARFAPVMATAKAHGIAVRGYVACAVACPYQGATDPAVAADVAVALGEMGCYQIALGDTIGVGTPNKVKALLEAVMKRMPVERLALHLHDTYGQALANIYAGLEMGISTFDSAVAGLGGCPYAKGASGNVATEDVVYLMNGLGIETGVDLQAVVDTAWFIAGHLGRKPASRVAQALGVAQCA